MIVKTTTDAFHLFYSVTDPPAITKRIVVFLHPIVLFSCAIASGSRAVKQKEKKEKIAKTLPNFFMK